MRAVIPFVMAPCDETLIPPLWAQLQHYDATQGMRARAIDSSMRSVLICRNLHLPGQANHRNR